jgi:hypothetical protein
VQGGFSTQYPRLVNSAVDSREGDFEMFALFLFALLVAIAVATVCVLADSGLRWWSAFGILRRELNNGAAPALPLLRRTVTAGGCAAFDRSGTDRALRAKINCAA